MPPYLFTLIWQCVWLTGGTLNSQITSQKAQLRAPLSPCKQPGPFLTLICIAVGHLQNRSRPFAGRKWSSHSRITAPTHWHTFSRREADAQANAPDYFAVISPNNTVYVYIPAEALCYVKLLISDCFPNNLVIMNSIDSVTGEPLFAEVV